jgi:hypothetical protein
LLRRSLHAQGLSQAAVRETRFQRTLSG